MRVVIAGRAAGKSLPRRVHRVSDSQGPLTRSDCFDDDGRVQVPDVPVGRRNAGVTKLRLNDVHRRSFAGQLKGVRVPQAVRVDLLSIPALRASRGRSLRT